MTFIGQPLRLLSTLLRRRAALRAEDLAVEPHLEAALAWIAAAHANALDGGIPAFYDLRRGRWTGSYPETTGYLAPTLLNAAEALGRPALRSLALELADYLLAARTPEGGVANWMEQGPAAAPMAFDTGQVIFGWLAAWQAAGQAAYLDAAVKAGDWLVGEQDASGAWVKHQYLGVVKVIDTRVAWALLCLAEISGREDYRQAARRNLDWALAQQRPDGWFSHAAFRPNHDPYTHTIVYTAEGLLEAGLLLDEPRYVAAAERTAAALMACRRPDGALSSTYGEGWRPTSRSSCLTGNCQAALLWLRLAAPARHCEGHSPKQSHSCQDSQPEIALLRPSQPGYRPPRNDAGAGLETNTNGAAYVSAARRAIAYVASTQDLGTTHPGVAGGIAGSYPIYGRYERLRYPNWAAKFFIDALLALSAAPEAGKYVG